MDKKIKIVLGVVVFFISLALCSYSIALAGIVMKELMR